MIGRAARVGVRGVSRADPADLPFCYLTTTGRITGRPHRIEIWFALHEGGVYLLAGGRDDADWVRNLRASPDVHTRDRW